MRALPRHGVKLVGLLLYAYVGLGSFAVAITSLVPNRTVRGIYGPYLDRAAFFGLFFVVAAVFAVQLAKAHSLSAALGNLGLGLVTTTVCWLVIVLPLVSMNGV